MPPSDIDISYEDELEDGISAMTWGIPIHIWETYPRRARAKMSAICRGKAILEHVAMEHLDGLRESAKPTSGGNSGIR